MRKRTTKEIYWQNRQNKSPLAGKLVVWAHNIRSMHNTGAIFRNCDAFGAEELWLSGFTPRPPRPEITKAAIGAEESVRWRSLETVQQGIERVRRESMVLAALEQTDKSFRLDAYVPPANGLCLLLGNEVTGVDEELLDVCDIALEIPQYGTKHSLNVSVASGIAMFALMASLLKETDS